MPDKLSKDKKRKKVKGKEGVYYREGKQLGTSKPERTYYIVYRNTAGKKVEEKAGVTSKGMTATDAAVLRAARIAGKDLSNSEKRELERADKEAWTFDKLWSEWKTVNANKKSRAVDDNRYKVHLQPLFGSKEPKDLTPLDADRLRVGMLKGLAPKPGRKFDPEAKRRADYSKKKKLELAEKAAKRELKPYAVGTVKSVLGLLTRIANFGADRQLCPGLSFKVKGPKGAKMRTEDMTEAQMAAYIKVCREWPDPQEGHFQLFMLFTGMRRSEVRNLKWTDIDSDRGFIQLRDPKGGEDAKVPLSEPALELLLAHPKQTNNQYVFAGEMGGPRGLRQIGEASRAIRNAAGLPADFRPNHGLRHTFASHLASSGEVDLYTLQKLMTHKSPQMTQRYAHLTDAALKRGANVMGRLMKEAGESA